MMFLAFGTERARGAVVGSSHGGISGVAVVRASLMLFPIVAVIVFLVLL